MTTITPEISKEAFDLKVSTSVILTKNAIHQTLEEMIKSSSFSIPALQRAIRMADEFAKPENKRFTGKESTLFVPLVYQKFASVNAAKKAVAKLGQHLVARPILEDIEMAKFISAAPVCFACLTIPEVLKFRAEVEKSSNFYTTCFDALIKDITTEGPGGRRPIMWMVEICYSDDDRCFPWCRVFSENIINYADMTTEQQKKSDLNFEKKILDAHGIKGSENLEKDPNLQQVAKKIRSIMAQSVDHDIDKSKIPTNAREYLSKQTNGTCASCGAKPEKPKICGGCKSVHYCSSNCQTNHWNLKDGKDHKSLCKLLALNAECAVLQAKKEVVAGKVRL